MATVANFGNQEKEEDKDKQQETGAPQAPQMGVQSAAAGGGAGQAPQAKQQGSGQFTNIKKFMEANKGAGQQIGQAIGSGVQRQVGVAEDVAKDQAEKFKAGLTQAQQNIQTGAGLLAGLGTEDAKKAAQTYAKPEQITPVSGPEALASDDKIAEYLKFRTGQVANEDIKTLKDRDLAAQFAAEKASGVLSGRQEQLKSEGARGQLLQDFVAKPTGYSQGARRLDQAFLQKDKSNTLANLSQALQTKQDTDIKSLLQNRETLSKEAQTAKDLSLGLSKDLGKQSELAASNLQATLEQAVKDKNDARKAEIAAFERGFTGLLDADAATQVTPEFLKKLNLQLGERTFNTINRDLTLDELASIDRSELLGPGGINKVANEEQIARINALNRLAGATLGAEGKVEYTGPSFQKEQLGDAINLKRNIRGEIDAAKQKWEDVVTGKTRDELLTNDIGDGRKLYLNEMYGDQFGPGFYAGAEHGRGTGTARATLSDLLAGKDPVAFGGSDYGGKSISDMEYAQGLAAQQIKDRLQALMDKYGYSDVLGGSGIEFESKGVDKSLKKS